MKNIIKHRLFWPSTALIALIVINAIARPRFIRITVQDGKLYGALIDILRQSAPLMLVALGMTIVIATRGIDLSVGAIMAVSGAVALQIIAESGDPNNPAVVATAVVSALLVSLVLGTWNGLLVAVVKIQPIIATLVLMLAGRGVALLITKGRITTINSTPFDFIANGYMLLLPFAFILAMVMVAIVAFVERRSALGVLTEAVGINPEASRLAGVRSRGIIWGAYMVSGVLAASPASCMRRTSQRRTRTTPASSSSSTRSLRWSWEGPPSWEEVHDRGNRDRGAVHPDPRLHDPLPGHLVRPKPRLLRPRGDHRGAHSVAEPAPLGSVAAQRERGRQGF
ncbi:MAG: ABC transporter permease [Demequina sp.]|nr:ABC transporter permease [Demequina sp.]